MHVYTRSNAFITYRVNCSVLYHTDPSGISPTHTGITNGYHGSAANGRSPKGQRRLGNHTSSPRSVGDVLKFHNISSLIQKVVNPFNRDSLCIVIEHSVASGVSYTHVH